MPPSLLQLKTGSPQQRTARAHTHNITAIQHIATLGMHARRRLTIRAIDEGDIYLLYCALRDMTKRMRQDVTKTNRPDRNRPQLKIRLVLVQSHVHIEMYP